MYTQLVYRTTANNLGDNEFRVIQVVDTYRKQSLKYSVRAYMRKPKGKEEQHNEPRIEDYL